MQHCVVMGKAFVFDRIESLMNFVIRRVENIVGGKKKCLFPVFSPFPTMFTIAAFFKVSKLGIVFNK